MSSVVGLQSPGPAAGYTKEGGLAGPRYGFGACTACSNVPPCVHAREHPSRVPGVCVDLGPWLGMQAAGGISAGQNGMGRALMAVRDELRAAADGRHQRKWAPS